MLLIIDDEQRQMDRVYLQKVWHTDGNRSRHPQDIEEASILFWSGGIVQDVKLNLLNVKINIEYCTWLTKNKKLAWHSNSPF